LLLRGLLALCEGVGSSAGLAVVSLHLFVTFVIQGRPNRQSDFWREEAYDGKFPVWRQGN
jgi:hypothetical protein